MVRGGLGLGDIEPMDRPIVAILAIGNELLRGDVENSNTRWLSLRLTERGARVVHVAIVRDEIEHIEREFHQALAYAPRLLLTTGGLGPTADDLTLGAIARATYRPLEPNPVALEMVAGRYAELVERVRSPRPTLAQADERWGFFRGAPSRLPTGWDCSGGSGLTWKA